MYDKGRQYRKKLNYSLSLPEAYRELFQIVPGTGQILTKSRVNWELLRELEIEGPDGGQYKTIEGPDAITATDTRIDTETKAPSPNTDGANVNIVVNDVNETALITTITLKAGTTEAAKLSEDREDTVAGRTVGSYEVEGREEVYTPAATWSVEGPDADDFSISSDSVLTFNAVLDYENPTDRDEDPDTAGDQGKGDNVYKVTVKAIVEGDEATRAVTVTVTDVDELGMLEGMPSVSYAEDRTDAVGTYTVSGANEAMATWTRAGADASHFMLDGSGASRMLKFRSSPNFEAPADADTDNIYMVTVKASYGGETEMVAVTVTVTDVEEEVEPSNVAPEFTVTTTTRSIAENTAAGTNIGGPVKATDSNSGDVLVYSLGGADAASFDIDSSTGQLQTLAALDYEDKNAYTVVVRATDPSGRYATINVTITVTDVDEGVPPVVPPVVPMTVQDYDTNGDGIDIDELFNAIDDYFTGGIITIDQLFQVIDAYFE